jgi:hypothetical protein
MKNKEDNNQLTLFTPGSVVNEAISTVFGAKAIPGKPDANGNSTIAGYSVQMNRRRTIAQELGLTKKSDSAALTEAILKQSDEAFRQVRAEIAGLDASWTLRKVANRTMSGGERQITVVMRQIARVTGPSVEAIAKALGITVDEVKAMQEAKAEREKPIDTEARLDSNRIEASTQAAA